jgi:site-specific DNA recombinase
MEAGHPPKEINMNNLSRRDEETVLRAIIYARVSTDRQEEEGSSFDVQVDNCTLHAKERGMVVVEVFREVFTGSLYRERPLLTKLRQMAQRKEFDVLLINTFDRLSRNQTQLAVLMDEMEHLGIQVVCIKENFDDTPTGQFMRNALGFVAEVERQKIIDRSLAGKMKRIEEGRLPRSWKVKYGYQWQDERKERYAYHEAEASVVHMLFTTFAAGDVSLGSLRAQLKVQAIPSPTGKPEWDKESIRRILSDPTYLGKAYALRYDGHKAKPEAEWVALPDGLIPPLVDEATFNRVQDILKQNKEEAAGTTPQREEGLLRYGFARCATCKRAMTVQRRLHRQTRKPDRMDIAYQCTYGRVANACPCPPRVNIYKIDDAVWACVREIIQDFSLVEKKIQALTDGQMPKRADLRAVERSMQSTGASIEQLAADLSQRNPDGSYKLKGTARQIIIDDLEALEERMESLEQEKGKIMAGMHAWEAIETEIETFRAWCLSARETCATATYEEKRRALKMLGIVVEIHRSGGAQQPPFEIKMRIPHLDPITL